jgi:hypothetical protein
MKVKRTYKSTSLKAGQVEIVDEAKAREVFGQTAVAHHNENECKDADYKGPSCFYCCGPAMKRLLAGAKVETFFSDFELIEA